jgi:MFS family permease
MLGLVYVAVALPVFFISPFAGWLCDRVGPKIPAVGGLLFSMPFLVLLRLPHASEDNEASQVVILCVILAFLGISYLRFVC